MKILFVATVSSHITNFHLPYLRWFKEQGWEVHVATNGNDAIPHCDVKYNIPIARSPFNINNIKAYFKLKKIIKREQYKIIHGHTPMGGVLARLCGKSQRKNGTRILYTAHGFHFYKGAPIINWLLYYPVEKWLSHYTDVLIAVNKEDFAIANKKMNALRICHIPEVGLDVSRFEHSISDPNVVRESLGIPADALFILSVGELSTRKNHKIMISAISALNDNNVYYCIAGTGCLEQKLELLIASIPTKSTITLLGHRKDVVDLLHAADIFAFPSLHEGLPFSVMEAMAAGLPCIVSNIRGNIELIIHQKSGYLCPPADPATYVHAIKTLFKNAILRKEMGAFNKIEVQQYDLKQVMPRMCEIYCMEMGVQE